MTTACCIELKHFKLPTRIGSYAPGETVPEDHTLDLTLWISPDLVLIAQDGMAQVFDYDPLVVQIEQVSADTPYETQERLLSRIVEACAQYPAIESLDIAVHKFPIRPQHGSLGVRMHVSPAQLVHLRSKA